MTIAEWAPGGPAKERRSGTTVSYSTVVTAPAALASAACMKGDEPRTVEGFVTVAGARLRSVSVGRGMSVIVLAGGPGFGFEYLRNPLVAALSDNLRLTFYEQRGFAEPGKGDGEPLTMARFVDDVEAVRGGIGADRVSLLGHSFGGLLALHYSLRYPERVDRIVVMEGDPVRRADWEEFRGVVNERRMPEDAAELASIRAIPGWEREPQMVEAYFRTFLRPYFARAELAAGLQFGFDRASYENLGRVSNAIRTNLGAWDMSAGLSAIHRPALLVYGGYSVFPLAAAESLAAGLPQGELAVLPGVGHFPFLEDPAGFRSLVLSFLGADRDGSDR